MKTNKLIIGLLAVAATSLVSCEKFGADVETPSVSISVSPRKSESRRRGDGNDQYRCSVPDTFYG
ncbi:hypothetical protein NXW84_18825 [Bacteroides fragilis]|nr:hypothetical protein [Bacteroides fragilis]MCS2670714.1 hypothetical protein [Bacteroides fragilis]UVV76103.1 hypothetical protein NXW84_18825 [Bacteroides fragilis]